MLLGVKPLVFLARLLALFALTFFAWALIAPYYARVLGVCIQAAISVTELVGDDTTRNATTVVVQDRGEQGVGIFFFHRLFPQQRWPGVPADWVQANMVLLIPLMLATPAPSIGVRLRRLGIALVIALLLQVFGVVVAIKSTWASVLGPDHYGWLQRKVYNFLDAFTQAFDTQLYPFAIWAGIHFRQLVGGLRGGAPLAAPAATAAVRAQPTTKSRKRRQQRGARS
jgi:hypothetical protein